MKRLLSLVLAFVLLCATALAEAAGNGYPCVEEP